MVVPDATKLLFFFDRIFNFYSMATRWFIKRDLALRFFYTKSCLADRSIFYRILELGDRGMVLPSISPCGRCIFSFPRFRVFRCNWNLRFDSALATSFSPSHSFMECQYANDSNL